MTIFYVCTLVTLASACAGFVYSLITVFSTKNTVPTGDLYTAARSMGLLCASIVPFFYHSVTWLAAIATCMIIVQFLDALIGIRLRELPRTVGPAAIAVVNLVVLVVLLR